MFSFSDHEYKWCPECNGNIRKDAYYCKYCRKPVGSKLLAAKRPRNISVLITNAAHWLPNFYAILDQMPETFRQRIQFADEDNPAPHIGLKPNVTPDEFRRNDRSSSNCQPNPPTMAELGLVWDVLLSLHGEQIPLAKICADERLQLLELTVGEIIAEYEMRVNEIQKGKKCSHCAEPVIKDDDERCRFCTGTATEVPEPSQEDPVPDTTRFDASLLRNILVWEFAARRINDEEPLPEKHRTKYAITDSDIEQQVLKLKQNPKMVPISRWRERMVQLGIIPAYNQDDLSMAFDCDFDYFCLQDIAALARALTPSFMRTVTKHANSEEAMIVIDHALGRWQDNQYFKREHYMLLSSKAQVYLSMKDNENYNRYTAESEKLLYGALPEGYRDLLQSEREAARQTPMIDRNASPEERLKALDEKLEEIQKSQAERMDRMNKLIPGFGEAFKSINTAANKSAEIARHSLKAQAALKKSDPVSACEEFEKALRLLGNELHDINRRCDLLVSLAEAHSMKGDAKVAEKTFLRALTDARDLEEAKSEVSSMSRIHHKYGCFLRDNGRYEEAEEHLKQGMVKHAELIQQYKNKGFAKDDVPLESWQMKSDYAALLKAMGRNKESEKTEEESQQLKERYPNA
ncbi:MAG: hypothetical protein JST44_22495 [Cyanobacteria bacterium SZAS LIN-5]|nr:hypothetical protein [Cyanobacteria bacterium SZAS LIN-5]